MIHIALIGAGGIAEKHAECLSKNHDVTISGIYDIDFQKVANMAVRYGATAYSGSDLIKCIDRSDAVYILTPPAYHKPLAIQAIQSDRAVFIEKPIAVTLEDAECIVEAAQRNRTNPVMLGFNMRFREGYKLLKNFMSTSVGQPITLWSQRFSALGGGGWRTDPKQLSGFTIESLSHDIDMFQWLTNSDIVSVYASVDNSHKELSQYDDNANVILNLRNGATASIQASWSSYLAFNSRGVIGTEGAARITGKGTWDFDTFHCRCKDWPDELTESLDDPLDVRSYEEINRYFINCVIHNQKPEMDAETGLRILKVSHAILRSSKTGHVVRI